MQPKEAGDIAGQIRRAFLLAYGRLPLPSETKASVDLLNDLRGDPERLALFCQALLASAEFRYLN